VKATADISVYREFLKHLLA